MIILLFVGLGAGDAGNRYRKSNNHVYMPVGRIVLSSALAEEGLGNFYLFKLYWRRERKHVDVAWKLKRFSIGYSGIENHGEHGEHGDVLFCSSP
jgi:hypothetical protein